MTIPLIDSKKLSGQFVLFAAGHSFLIGLLPFYLPVLVWEQTRSFAQLCFFIALTGLGFVLSLGVWSRLRHAQAWRSLFAVSFVLELLIVMGMLFHPESAKSEPLGVIGWVLIALINGAYACFYWTTQRVLFNAFTDKENSGKHFGNFQMLVAVLLKIGIFVGGWLLEYGMALGLIVLSGISSVLCYRAIGEPHRELSNADQSLNQQLRLETKTKAVFLMDGVFLYLESYFWVLTLYLVLQESFSTLGMVVVVLTIALSALFWLIRGWIDRYNVPGVFYLAVGLYAMSWWIRALVGEHESQVLLYVSITMAAFFTAYFRLVFNKRFFDAAKQDNPERYIVLKSYWSQWGMVVFFAIAGVMASLSVFGNDQLLENLSTVYGWMIPISLAYILYEKVGQAPAKTDAALVYRKV